MNNEKNNLSKESGIDSGYGVYGCKCGKKFLIFSILAVLLFAAYYFPIYIVMFIDPYYGTSWFNPMQNVWETKLYKVINPLQVAPYITGVISLLLNSAKCRNFIMKSVLFFTYVVALYLSLTMLHTMAPDLILLKDGSNKINFPLIYSLHSIILLLHAVIWKKLRKGKTRWIDPK